MSHEQEEQLDAWIESRKRDSKHYRVTEVDIRLQVEKMFNLVVIEHCVRKFMQRWKWSVRKRTTTKQVTGVDAQRCKEAFGHLMAGMLAGKPHWCTFNCDETSINLDAPGNYTVERLGAPVVEIGTSGHELDRVMVMLCVDRAGNMVTPYVIHPGSGIHQPAKLVTVQGEAGPFEMFVGYGGKGWLDGAKMSGWMEKVYYRHIVNSGQHPLSTLLFMDNCASHTTDEVIETSERLQLPWCTFPPYMTPLLQPIGQFVNSSASIQASASSLPRLCKLSSLSQPWHPLHHRRQPRRRRHRLLCSSLRPLLFPR